MRRAGAWLPGVVALLVTLVMLNVSPVLPLLRADFGLSNAEAGLLLSATLLTHAAAQIPGGSLIDAIGCRKSLLIALTGAAVCTLASGAATGFWTLLVLRALLGLGTGGAVIAGLVLARELAPKGRRQASQSIYGGLLTLGALLALASAPLAASAGWQLTFFVEGLLLAALLVVCWLLLPPSPRSAHEAPAPWRALLADRRLYGFAAAHTGTYGLFMTLAAWSPSFLVQSYQLDLGTAGVLAAGLTVSAAVSRGLGGMVPSGRGRAAILASTATVAGLLFLLPLAPSAAFAVAILFLVGVATSLPFGAVFGGVARACAPTAVGRATGIVSAISNGGAFLCPVLIGGALDLSGQFLLGFWTVGAVGLLCVGLAALYLDHPAGRDLSVAAK
jgi:nitrate/nitrite transporter NarK